MTPTAAKTTPVTLRNKDISHRYQRPQYERLFMSPKNFGASIVSRLSGGKENIAAIS